VVGLIPIPEVSAKVEYPRTLADGKAQASGWDDPVLFGNVPVTQVTSGEFEGDRLALAGLEEDLLEATEDTLREF